MENYKQYKIMGSVKRIRLKADCVPTRFECRTNGGTSTPSELNEPQFGVRTPNSQSEQCNLLSLMETEDCGLKEDVTEAAPHPTSFCICCLKGEVPVVSLLTCSHADFLNSFLMPEIKPQNQVVCYQCHEKLKKIKLFKLQVEESFKLLSDTSTENTLNCSNQRHNLTIRHVFKIEIPQTNVNNIENPQTIVEDANANTDSDDIIKEEINFVDNTEKSLPTNSLQTKKMKNIEEALRIINNNQNSDCINFLATSLQSLSHSLLSDLYTNFGLGSRNDTNPTDVITALTNNISTANSTENITNNLLDKTSIENSEIINDEIDKMISENADVVENVANDEFNQPVTEKKSVDVGESNNIQMDATLIADILDKRPSLSSSIKQLTLTREQLMQEREKIATSQSYLRAPHRCESCLIGFQFQENLDDHVKRKHTSGGRNTVECDVCLQYVDYGARNMHLFWHHTRYECVACTEKFASYDKAAVHYRKNHHNARSSVLFKCPHCPYKTGRKTYFTDHLNTYTKCKLCGVMLGCATGNKRKFHMRNCAGSKLKTEKLTTVSKAKKAKVKPTTGPILKNMQRII